MIIRQGYRYQLRTKGSHERQLRRYVGCCRFVWNKALALVKERIVTGERAPRYVTLANQLPQWKIEHPFLAEAPSQVLQQTLKDLDRAIGEAFDKTNLKRFPRFKRRGDKEGIRFPQGFDLDSANGRVKLPKLGWLRYRNSRDIEGVAKNITITHDALGWHVAIQTERDGLIPSTATTIGAADRGITNFLATDSGDLVEPRNAHKTALYRLRRYQRSMCRKIEAAKVRAGIPKGQPFPKGFRLVKTNRMLRAQAKLARIQAQVARQRKDFLHKLSTRIAETHAAFVLEDLKVANMSASAGGTIETPGRNVRQKAGLNRSILDQGWHTFQQMLGYKLSHRGGELVLVPPQYTSQKCACCGYTDSANRKGEAFRCLACGHTDHSDINAAKNILAAGLAVLAGDEYIHGQADVEDAAQSGRPVKRQPTKGLRHAA